MGIFDKFVELEYNRNVDKKINKFFENTDYLNRMKLRYAYDSIDVNKIKIIIKSEITEENIENFNINSRFIELLKMDVDTLYEMTIEGIDTSQFISQSDLDNYYGKEYASSYDIKKEELSNKSSRKFNTNVKTLPKDYIKQKKEEPVKFGPKIKKKSSPTIMASAEKLEKLLYEDNTVEEPKKEKTPKKNKILINPEVDIEMYTKVKSNTALASAALFLVSGVLVGEAKEEMKWVKTKINVKDDRIIIKKPYSIHKYKDFTIFEVNQENAYYLFYIGFKDQSMIHFRTKEKYLKDLIVNKINARG